MGGADHAETGAGAPPGRVRGLPSPGVSGPFRESDHPRTGDGRFAAREAAPRPALGADNLAPPRPSPPPPGAAGGPPGTLPHPVRPGHTLRWHGVICCSCYERVYEERPGPEMAEVLAADGSVLGRTRQPAGDHTGTLCRSCRPAGLLR